MRKKIIITFMLFLTICGNVFAREIPQLTCKSAVLLDMESGRVLYNLNKDLELPQASITKLMTYYVFKDYMKAAQINENTLTAMGDIKAWNLPKDGSFSGIKSGENVTYKQLLDALLIVSGNDSAMMLGDLYNKTGRNIINAMNNKAKELGLNKSRFFNVSGLTVEVEGKKVYNTTTAYETAILGSRLIETYPEVLSITSNKYYNYKNIKIPNTNKLLFDSELSVDGLKTGHTDEAGYCLISTEKFSKDIKGKPMRLIAVVFGSPRESDRFSDSKKLLLYGENNYSYEKLCNIINVDNAQFQISNEYYKGGRITATIPKDAYLLKGKDEKIKYNVIFNTDHPKTIKQGDNIGKIVVITEDNSKFEYNLVAREDFKSVSFIKRIILNIKHLLKL